MTTTINGLIAMPNVGYCNGEYSIVTPYKYRNIEYGIPRSIVVYVKSLKDGTLFTEKGRTFEGMENLISLPAIQSLIKRTNKEMEMSLKFKKSHFKLKTDTMIYDSDNIRFYYATFLQTLIKIHCIIEMETLNGSDLTRNHENQ